MMTIEQMTVAQQDDMALVAECRRGNREAFRQVVERNQTLVCSVAYAALGNKNQSEEVAQDTFVTAWRQLGDLREPACTASVRGTRWSFAPCTMKIGLVIFAAWFSGEIRSKIARLAGSRSSLYSTRRKSRP